MSGSPWRSKPGPVGRHAVWTFNWLANHKIVRAIERVRHHAKGELLDVGCGAKPFAPLFAGQVRRYWGTDLAASVYRGAARLDAFARGEALPFRAGSFDTVVGFSIVTYMPEPVETLREAHRVLKPGGVLIMEFTQMVPLHDAPHDYFRYTKYGATYLLEKAGFEVVETHPIGGLMARVGLSAIAALNRLNRGAWRPLTELPVRLAYVVLQVGFEVLDRLCFDPAEVLAHMVVARRRP